MKPNFNRNDAQTLRLKLEKNEPIADLSLRERQFLNILIQKHLVLPTPPSDGPSVEKDLLRTKDIFEKTGQMSRIGTWEMDMHSRTIRWSSMTREIYEVSSNFIPELDNILTFFPDPDVQQQIKDAVAHTLATGEPYLLEALLTTAKDNNVWVRIIGYTEFEQGACTRLYGTIQDINAVKKAKIALLNEQSILTAFIENTPAPVAMFDREIRYITYSRRWLEDYKLGDQVLKGRSHYEVFPNISEEWKAIHQRCLAGAIEKREEERWRPQGWPHDQFLSWEVRPWYKYDGTIGGIMMLTQDVTELCIQREQLKEAQKQAENASRAKSEFLANMSHEIRTPLNGVIGFTDLILKTDLTDIQTEYLSIVNQSAHSLLDIISDILDFSKIEAGKLDLDETECDLFELTSQSLDVIKYAVQKKGLEILLNINHSIPQFILADNVRLKQILINLLSNASKFTREGEIELSIDLLARQDTDKTLMRFSVRDTGEGIKPENQRKIFEAFAQEDISTTKKYGGTGLGLAISNKLLSLMGSSLQLVSRPGQGSTFYFDVAFQPVHRAANAARSILHIQSALIVDDNTNNRLIIKQILQPLGIQCAEAKNGLEALQMIYQGKHFDVIISDYEMPILNGLETVRKIKEVLLPEAKSPSFVLLYSSAEDETIYDECAKLDIQLKLAKPIKSEQLLDTLAKTRSPLLNGFGAEKTDTKTTATSAPDKIFTVLISEDNLVNMLLLKTIIEQNFPSAAILEATNGKEAIDLCLRHEPALVFMDIQMPVMNGYEATQAIKKVDTFMQTPVIAITAANVKGEREKCVDAGMSDFITKPYIEEDVIALINRWIKI